MAIFASTTTSGYSDPLKAYSIKALEQRQKDLLAQQAADKPDAAMMATIPGGIGHVLGQVGDMMQQRRADQALASQRDVLSKAITGYNPDSGPPPAAVAATDPELYKSLLQTWAENRRAAATDTTTRRGQDTSLQGIQGTNQTSRDTTKMTTDTSAANTQATIGGEAARLQTKIEADKAAAAEAAKVATQQKVDSLDLVGLNTALEQKKITPEQHADAVKKLNAGTPAEQEHIIKHQLESADAQASLNAANRALELIDSPAGIHAGPQSSWKQSLGEKTPAALQGVSKYQPDPKTTENTQRFNQIMNTEVLAMLNAMKGSSSENELRFNYKIANDPDATIANKREAVQFIINKYNEHVKILNAGVEKAGGTAPKVERPNTAGAATAPAADPLEGRTANGPDGPIIRRGGKWVPNG